MDSIEVDYLRISFFLGHLRGHHPGSVVSNCLDSTRTAGGSSMKLIGNLQCNRLHSTLEVRSDRRDIDEEAILRSRCYSKDCPATHQQWTDIQCTLSHRRYPAQILEHCLLYSIKKHLLWNWRNSETLCTFLHPHCISLRTKQNNAIISCPLSLHSFKQALPIV